MSPKEKKKWGSGRVSEQDADHLNRVPEKASLRK